MSKNPNPFSNPRSHYRSKSLPNPRSKRLPIIDPATMQAKVIEEIKNFRYFNQNYG